MENKNNLKEEYNKTLHRYYNGCNYISEHLDETDKYLDEVMKLHKKLQLLIEKIGNMSQKEILDGFTK